MTKRKPKKKPSAFRSFIKKLFIVGVIIAALGTIYLDATIRTKFEGQKWDLPAKVYARPLELFVGQTLNRKSIETELKALGYQSSANTNTPGTYSRSGDRFNIHSRGFSFADGEEQPQLFTLALSDGAVSSLRSNNKNLDIIRLEPVLIAGIYPTHNEDRELVAIEDVPPLLTDTLLAVEDRGFYSHFGISIRGITRAMLANIKARSFRQGGSTITQQLIKNFYLTQDRTLLRKLLEVPMSILLEFHYSKDEILEAYLNEVYLGQAGKRGIHGFGLASHHYFSQPLNELDTDQIALLVAVVKGASYYNPWKYPERTTNRRNLVLDTLATQNIITAEEAENYKQKPLGINAKPRGTASRYPAFMQLIRQQLQQDYEEEDLQSEGLRIFTSLDPVIQWEAESTLQNTLNTIEKDRSMTANVLQGAVVVTDSQNGEIQALVGDRNPNYLGFNRALDAVRQIGSVVKPAVALTALERPDFYSLTTPLKDEPISLKTGDGKIWTPKNYDGKTYGDVPLYRAIAKSYNLATANLGLEMGVDAVADTLRSLGVQRDIPRVPALLLGVLELTPFEVAQMYQTFASDGSYTPLRAIREVVNTEGQPLTRYPYKVEQRFTTESIYLLNYALQAVVREGTGKSVYYRLPESVHVAAKTGTTNNQRDSWAAGFSDNHLSVVWIGRDDNKSTPLTGSSGALRVWARLMGAIPQRSLSLDPPAGIEYHWVNVETNELSMEGCPQIAYIPFHTNFAPGRKDACARSKQEITIPNPVPAIKSWFRRVFK